MDKESFNVKKTIIEKAFEEKEQALKEEIEVLTDEENLNTPNPALEKEKIQNERVPVKKQKVKLKKSVKISFLIFFILIGTILGISYFDKNYINNKKVILKKSLVLAGNELLKIVNLPKESTKLGENFTITSKIKTSLTSEYLNNNYLNNKKLEGYYNYLNNINNLDTTYIIKQDLKNKMFFYNKQSKFEDNLIINDKYIIKDSTEYYYGKSFKNTYINNGNNNYFESFSKEDNSYSNLKYLYKHILKNISNYIDKNKIKKTTTKIENEKLKKYSVILNKDELLDLYNKIISSFKNDPKSSKIMNAFIDDFDSVKVNKKSKILNKYNSIELNIYTKGITNQTKIVEMHFQKHNLIKTFSIDISENQIKYLINNTIKNIINYEIKNKNITLDLLNSNNKSIAKVRVTKSKNNISYKISYNEKAKNFIIDINSKDSNMSKSSYKNTINIKISYKEDNISKLNGKIQITSDIKSKVHIDEHGHEIVFSNSISKEDKEKIENLFKERLMKPLIKEQGE